MITKNDCLLLLYDIQQKGVDTTEQTKQLIRDGQPSVELINFINKNRELGLTAFYRKIRKSYNNKKSKLYVNIMKSDEVTETTDKILTTLSGLLTQILLFSEDVEDKEMFLRHARCGEITTVLNKYFKDYDITNCIKLMQLIKADIKALESIQ